jgi:hypothetical protein
MAGLDVVEKVLTTSIHAANRKALHAVKRSGYRRAMTLEPWAKAQVERLIAPLGTAGRMSKPSLAKRAR